MAGERPGHSLQATALVNEAYLRLINVQKMDWQNRAHFLAMASRLMRRVLVDFARANASAKRGGGSVMVSLDEAAIPPETPGPDLVALNDALEALTKVNARRSQVVEMRFFGGLSVDETADALGVSPQTVLRDWQLAKVWLLREISGEEPR